MPLLDRWFCSCQSCAHTSDWNTSAAFFSILFRGSFFIPLLICYDASLASRELASCFNIDLHCHSTASDGLLSPTQLVEHAATQGVAVLALTDHDDVAGLDEARRAAVEKNIVFINGVEISVNWRGQTLHIVGLGIDPDYPQLAQGLTSIREGRTVRAGISRRNSTNSASTVVLKVLAEMPAMGT